ncbi:MAG: ATP-binding protein [Bacteroidales bacterium]|nr:ATP-binding protein [Bacteroidales bacterium]
MKFVDRKKEIERLTRILNMESPSFVVVRGRRRLGKSTLIKRVLSETDIYYEADKTEAPNQRALLASIAAHVFEGIDSVNYPSWESLFNAINYRVDKKITLCLDEFPYLVKVSPELPSVIQKMIDSGGLKYNIIVCGSSQTMMYSLLYDESSPLYGRSDSDFRLNPIKLPYLQEALSISAKETVEEYALWGGVPRYWVLREKSGSKDNALSDNVFSSQGILYEEPQRLFNDDINDIVKTSTIMSLIGKGATRLKEIASRCEEPATNLTRPIAKLIDLGYIEREIPFGESPKSSKKSFYRICEPFLSFHFKFVAPMRSFIELERFAPVYSYFNEQFSTYVGGWWEKICRDAVTGNIIDGNTYSEASRWWGNVVIDGKPQDVELDIVSESIDKKTILIGECKWTKQENARLLTERLQKIAQNLPFAQGKNIVIKLFLKNQPEEPQGNHFLPEDVIGMMM